MTWLEVVWPVDFLWPVSAIVGIEADRSIEVADKTN